MYCWTLLLLALVKPILCIDILTFQSFNITQTFRYEINNTDFETKDNNNSTGITVNVNNQEFCLTFLIKQKNKFILLDNKIKEGFSTLVRLILLDGN